MHVHVRSDYEDNGGHETGAPGETVGTGCRRGQKGFSSVLAEAIEAYVRAEAVREVSRRKALRLRGAISRHDGERLRQTVRSLREF